jgi:hypothetical protein
MSVHPLLEEFIAEDRAGGVADPAAYLARVSGAERAELEALLDAYLARAPRRPFDRAAFADSGAARVADALDRSLGAGGTWPALLPRLRDRAQLRRAEVVARLAGALGVGDREAKVAAYYHAMEQGTLPASGVSDRVLEALAGIVGASAAVLREAGASMGGGGGAPSVASGGAFARVATPPPEFAAPAAPGPDVIEERDEVDELFTAGP